MGTTTGKYQSQSLLLTLSALQAAGNATSGDFYLGASLPTDCIVLGITVAVTTALAGPGLISAEATVGLAPDSPRLGHVLADLMTVGSYDDGGQSYLVSILLHGCPLDALTAGSITVTVYYDQFKI